MVVPYDRFIRRLFYIWIVSLIGIAGLTFLSSFMFDNAVSQTETYTEIINLAGRQRTLSQQILLFAGEYVDAETDARRAPHGRQLRAAVDTMRGEFGQLETRAPGMQRLNALYYDGAAPLATVNNGYWDAVDTLLGLPVNQLSTETPSYLAILEDSGTILHNADLGVQAVRDSSIESFATLRQINTIRLLLIFTVLGGQLFFGYRPMIIRLYEKATLLQQEIADRRRFEADLKASEQRFRLLIENAPVGIFQADPHGAIIWVNPQWERTTGIKRDSVSSMPWTEVIHPEERMAAVALVEQNVSAGTGFELDFRLDKASKPAVMLHAIVTPLKASDGAVISYIGTLMDITERKRAFEQELRLQNERQRVTILGQFIRDTSHDLRTPLSVIKSGLYLAGRSNDLDRVREKIAVVDQHVSYLTVVIEQLHEMALLDTRTELTLMPMYVTPLLRDMMNDLAQLAETSGKTTCFELEADLPPVLIAPDKLIQAIRAVTNNAFSYTEPGDTITIKAAQVGNYVDITITDDGIGIAPEHLPHVFDRFYKVDKARAIGSGAGLGLSIARRVVELHGGQITLESELGKGTTVSIRLIIANNRLADLFAR